MTSSSTGSRSLRRFAWLTAGIVVAIGAYTAGWYYVADLATRRANDVLAAFSRGGNRAVCEKLEARGYPFRIGLFCSATFLENRREGISVSTSGFRSAAQIYSPYRVVAELDGPARVTLPGVDPLDVSWATLRSSARLARPLPKRVSVEATDLSAKVDRLGGQGLAALSARLMELHMRPAPNGMDVDLAARFDGLRLEAAMLAGGTVPPVSGAADIAWLGAATTPPRGLRGAEFEIRMLELTAANGARLSVRGRLSIGEDGLLDGELDVTADDAAALSELLSGAFPDFADRIETALSGLAALGPRPSLPLRIADGEMTLGFLPLGTVPAL